MYAPATFIRITLLIVFAGVLSSCSVESTSKFNSKAALDKVKGPEISSIDTTLLDQAQQAENADDFKRAAEIYKQLADKSPNNIDYAINLASNLRRAGDSRTALKILDKVVKKAPANPAALEGKGLCLMNIGDYGEASKTFGEVMKIDEKRWRTLNAIGILFAMKSLFPESLAYYQEALNQSVDNPSVLNNVGITLAMNKQYDRALEAFDHAKRHLPASSSQLRAIDLNLALVYAIAGRLDDAEHAAAPHLSKAGLYNNMGFYAELSKNNEMAKSYLNMALMQSPVYYERAWKNLNALNGDAPSNNDGPSKSLSGNSLFTQAPPSKQVAIPVDDIPQSGGADRFNTQPTEKKSVILSPFTETHDNTAKDKDATTSSPQSLTPPLVSPPSTMGSLNKPAPSDNTVAPAVGGTLIDNTPPQDRP